MQEFNDDVEYLVEASSYEHMKMYMENYESENKLVWEDNSRGYIETVGHIGERPIVIHMRFERLNGHLVCFYEPSSQLVDYVMIEEWLNNKFKNVKSRSDSMNFGNVYVECRDAG